MKKLWILPLLLVGQMSYGQTSAPIDTVPVQLDHLYLEDVLVLDEWMNDHKPRSHDHH